MKSIKYFYRILIILGISLLSNTMKMIHKNIEQDGIIYNCFSLSKITGICTCFEVLAIKS